MRKPHIIFLIGLLICTSNISFAQISDAPRYIKDIPPLERKVTQANISWNLTEIRTITMHSLSRTRMPGGFASLFYEDKEPQYNFQLESFYLKDILDAIVKKESRYQWKLDNSVINILPREKMPSWRLKFRSLNLRTLPKKKCFQL